MQHGLDQIFATHCAPALAGIAPANVISLWKKEFPNLEQDLAEYQRAFVKRGICFARLCSCQNRDLVLVYRPTLMIQTLSRNGVAELLEPWGYDLTKPVEEIVEHLSRRICQSSEFPHEIGLFLGYPVEDVVGFIEHGGQNFKLCGAWKVYGDVCNAQECFRRIQRVSQKVRQFVDEGRTLFQIFLAAS